MIKFSDVIEYKVGDVVLWRPTSGRPSKSSPYHTHIGKITGRGAEEGYFSVRCDWGDTACQLFFPDLAPETILGRLEERAEAKECACGEKILPDERTGFTVAYYGSDGRDAFHGRDKCTIKRQA